MAPALPVTASSSGTCSPLPQDIFEGPEKKLFVSFYPSDDRSSDAPTLRSLSPSQIETVTDAAKCTILSHVSNDVIDAYLLSESSLFVTDYSMTIKTCGTTTLLLALDVILHLGASIGFSPERVYFTRAAYLFPQHQFYPHNSFESEVAYLDTVLRSYGRVIRNAANVSTNWFYYLASFSPAEYASKFLRPPTPTHTLEIAMYDLDPRGMRQFMFHSDPSRVGRDDLVNGSTARSGVLPLLSKADAIDAHNFAPCGYSLNAVASCGGYYTIHVTPEDGSSYLSFEATVEVDNPAKVVASVVHLFRPSRFTVSVISATPISCVESSQTSSSSYFDSEKLDKLLCGAFSSTSPPNIQELAMPTCDITTWVSTYHSKNDLPIMSALESLSLLPSPDLPINLASVKGAVANALAHVSKSYGAISLPVGIHLDECKLSSILPPVEQDSVQPPTLVIDLARVCRNYLHIVKAAKNPGVELRYATRCCSDVALLELLAGFGKIVFEVADTGEVALLDGLGVPKERLVLRVTVPTTSTLGLIDRVGGIVLHEIPDPDVAAAIQRSKVFVELVSTDKGSVEELNDKMSLVQDSTKAVVRGVGWDESRKDTHLSKGRGVYLHVHDENAAFMGIAFSNSVVDGEEYPVVFEISSYLMNKAMSIVLSVIGQRMRSSKDVEEGCKSNKHIRRQSCHMNDGMYGIFGGVWLQDGASVSQRLKPRLVDGRVEDDAVKNEEFQWSTTVWGPTCDASDRIWDGCLAEVGVGERLVFDNIGAYSLSSVTKFNGFSNHLKHVYVTSRCCWDDVG